MKQLFYSIFVFALASCGGRVDDNPLQGSAFHFAPEFDSTVCKVSGACDCCSYDLLFPTDSTFIMVDLCLADETIFLGRYAIKDDSLLLYPQTTVLDKISNWDAEEVIAGTVEASYSYTLRQIPLHITRYTFFYCDNKLCMKYNEDGGVYYGVKDETADVDERVAALKAEGVFDRLRLE